jgi:hypothetical protein
MDRPGRSQRLVAAGMLGFLLFGYPLMALFDRDTLVLGVPLLWAYLLVAWAALIAVAAALVRRSR